MDSNFIALAQRVGLQSRWGEGLSGESTERKIRKFAAFIADL